MKKLFKMLSLILVMIMLAGALGGCGGETGMVTEENGFKVVTVWAGDPHARIAYDTAVYEFNQTIGKENKIKLIYESKDNVSDALTVALQTDQAPQIFSSGDVAEYSEQGYIVPLDDLKGGKELIESRKEFLIEGKQVYKGKTYSLPYATTTRGLIYNKDMFKAAGLVDENGEPTPPKTIAEVREYAKKLTNKSKGEFGIILPMKWLGLFDCDVLPVVVASTGTDGYDYTTGKYDFGGYKEVIEMYKGIQEDKSFMPGEAGLDNDTARARFAEGKIGMKFAVSWDVGVLNDQFPAKCDWGVAPVPVINPDDTHFQPMTGNTGYKISSKAVEQVGEDALMCVYKWLNGKELATRTYELGVNLPMNFSEVADADTSNLKKGWEDFAKLSEISVVLPPKPNSDISGETDFATNFFNSVWPGKMSVDEAISEANRVMNEGVAKYAGIHPETKPEDYIIPGWSIKR